MAAPCCCGTRACWHIACWRICCWLLLLWVCGRVVLAGQWCAHKKDDVLGWRAFRCAAILTQPSNLRHSRQQVRLGQLGMTACCAAHRTSAVLDPITTRVKGWWRPLMTTHQAGVWCGGVPVLHSPASYQTRPSSPFTCTPAVQGLQLWPASTALPQRTWPPTALSNSSSSSNRPVPLLPAVLLLSLLLLLLLPGPSS